MHTKSVRFHSFGLCVLLPTRSRSFVHSYLHPHKWCCLYCSLPPGRHDCSFFSTPDVPRRNIVRYKPFGCCVRSDGIVRTNTTHPFSSYAVGVRSSFGYDHARLSRTIEPSYSFGSFGSVTPCKCCKVLQISICQWSHPLQRVFVCGHCARPS